MKSSSSDIRVARGTVSPDSSVHRNRERLGASGLKGRICVPAVFSPTTARSADWQLFLLQLGSSGASGLPLSRRLIGDELSGEPSSGDLSRCESWCRNFGFAGQIGGSQITHLAISFVISGSPI